MHKIPRLAEPDGYAEAVSNFSRKYPPADVACSESKRWQAFKDEERELHKEILHILYTNQHGLCAFCECTLTEHNREIEHFVPKMLSTTENDWTLRFDNFTMSCKGKRVVNEDDHCGHLKGNINPVGKIISPYDLADVPIVKYEIKADRKLLFVPDEEACARENIATDLVAGTIDNLGLNCASLAEARWEIWNGLEEQIIDIMDTDADESCMEFKNLVDSNLNPDAAGTLRPFVTTRLLVFMKDLPEFVV